MKHRWLVVIGLQLIVGLVLLALPVGAAHSPHTPMQPLSGWNNAPFAYPPTIQQMQRAGITSISGPQAAPQQSDCSTVHYGTGVITGKVTAADTGEPLEGVYVVAYNGTTYASSGSTDATGSYRMEYLSTGSVAIIFYALAVESSPAFGYVDEWYNNQPSQATANLVSVMDGQTTPNIDVALEKGGRITGKVTAADTGAPLQSVYVTLYNTDGSVVESATTDATGMYSTDGVRTGTYKIEFNPYSSAYTREFYNHKPDLATADAVTVTAPNLTSNINSALPRGAQITGKVTLEGQPFSGASITVLDSNGRFVTNAYSGDDGMYRTPGLQSGSYKLSFGYIDSKVGSSSVINEYYNDKTNLASAEAIAVTAPNIRSGADVDLAQGGAIRGQVTANGSVMCGTQVTIYDSTKQPIYMTTPEASGSYFTRTGLPSGTYYVGFVPPENSGFSPLFYNNKPSLDTADPITITGTNVRDDINAVFAGAPGVQNRRVYLPFVAR